MAIPSHLKSLQALELAIRTGSFKRAGELLGLTAAAAGQRVKTLEDYLGVELVVRGRAGIRPTSELRAALPHLERAFAELGAASRELDLQRGQELHIAAPTDLVELWLRPRLPKFRQAHPNIFFCINGEGDASMRLARVDCRIEFCAPRQASEVEFLFPEYIVPISSPAIRDRTAKMPAQSRLEGFPLLHLDTYRDDPASPTWPSWLAACGIARSAPDRGIRFRRVVPALNAILADAGICLSGIALLENELEASAVALPYPIGKGVLTSHAFVAHFPVAASANRPHVQRFRNWLALEAAGTQSWLRHVTCS
ncbi:MAG: LysR family transcriptional regulator [Ramlibacter sp.]|nr:LysR family transcriptional regulator [Ramlibacter sp.]